MSSENGTAALAAVEWVFKLLVVLILPIIAWALSSIVSIQSNRFTAEDGDALRERIVKTELRQASVGSLNDPLLIEIRKVQGEVGEIRELILQLHGIPGGTP